MRRLRQTLLRAAPLLVWAAAARAIFAADEEKPALIERIADRDLLLPGSWAQGSFDDWALGDGRFRVIVAGVNSKELSPYPAGTVVDVARLDDAFDELGFIEPMVFDGAGRHLFFRMTEESVGERETSGVQTLVFRGVVAGTPGLKAETRYLVGETPWVVRVTTTVVNETTTTLFNLSLGDRVNWALLSPFVERFGVPNPNAQETTYSSWIGARMDDNSAGIVAGSGQIEAMHQGPFSFPRYGTKYELAPGERFSATRRLYVGGPNFAELAGYALRLRKEPYGTIEGQAVAGPELKGVPDIDLAIETYRRMEEDKPPLPRSMLLPAAPYTIARTDAEGRFTVDLPVGRAIVTPKDLTRMSPATQLGQPVLAGEVTDVEQLEVSQQATLTLRVTDAQSGRLLPCKVQLLPVAETVPVRYGPPYRASGGRFYWYLATGEETIPLPRGGRYQILISRGLEYNMHEGTLVVEPAKNMRYEAALERVVETKGYLGVDLGVMTEASYNCRVTARDAVVAAAGEGVEWVVSGDINRATDLGPAIEAAGLRSWIGASRGMTPEPMTHNLGGRFHVFPVESLAPDEPFTADWAESDSPGEFLRRLRGAFPHALLTVMRPYADGEGYFRTYDFDFNRCLVPPGDFWFGFDQLEFMDGRIFRFLLANTQIYGCMLRAGRPYVPVGASSSRELFGNEPGYPRTYVKVADDDPSKVSEAEIVESLRKGAVVVTNGPFIQMTIDGKGPGELVQAHDKKVVVSLEVWAMPRVEVSAIEFRKDGMFCQKRMRPAIQDPLRYPRKDATERREIELGVEGDVALQATVSGVQGPMPLIASFAGREPIDYPPFATTAPIFIDGDGDGKYSPPPDGKPRN
ncbi:MAG: hypothetical protein NTW86_04380 [Candidatus Sumerlaeota bacterium]|nr:hypothetical protein [Candidatus Sumerlaeota bacterium]